MWSNKNQQIYVIEIKTDVLCPKCSGNNVIRKGKQETKFGPVQLFYCKDCNRKFSKRGMKNKTYPPGVILNSLNFYNLGKTLKESSKMVNKKLVVINK
ncbi:MAG: hypothetical protein CVT88_02765 [Candidatus Altiarchaeales archaeon HGW-Altiarchaeales-1]|nr:MAG: hypothetical protein CVT88_02765 [Candidatus Altiarchaeales archaeon HGW-Altiarchaeales-1]